MGGESQNEINHLPYRERGSNTIHALYNPSLPTFREIDLKSATTILDIGCGFEPRVSWELKSKDLWVGCDPAIAQNKGGFIPVKNSLTIAADASLVVFNDIAADIFSFKPDIISCIAPNPKDVVEGKVFNDELDKFLSDTKTQTFCVVLDSRTFEAHGYSQEAKKTISDWMKEYKFKRVPYRPDYLNRFKANSADLEEGAPTFYFLRLPR